MGARDVVRGSGGTAAEDQGNRVEETRAITFYPGESWGGRTEGREVGEVVVEVGSEGSVARVGGGGGSEGAGAVHTRERGEVVLGPCGHGRGPRRSGVEAEVLREASEGGEGVTV